VILMLGGTKDARVLAGTVRAAFPDVVLAVSVVSEYGAALLQEQKDCVVLQGKMDAAAMAVFIRKNGVRVLLDATHPFAEQVTAQAKQASKQCGIDFIRYERPALEIEAGGGVYFAADFTAAAHIANRLGEVIFLTVGSRHLAEMVAVIPSGKKVVARVLPDPHSVQHCLVSGLAPWQIVAVQGPVSTQLNAALFSEFKADVVVSKESGEAGGTPEKVAAARQLKIPIVLVRRPGNTDSVGSPSEIISMLRRIFQRGDKRN
jgi:precorrin-6A/cobalt-precorrin-6A reductase